eukprot:TRINITY_DN91364_c0_g1_i1.p1 TRINITY_DN91364_c0_g1~~TRINITY_DN91364_c0_g1_i1.p1  ORF type:complete len:394 (+),score=95.88 TRINITY_DN91364_c0_g1_i1:23-1183(+)
MLFSTALPRTPVGVASSGPVVGTASWQPSQPRCFLPQQEAPKPQSLQSQVAPSQSKQASPALVPSAPQPLLPFRALRQPGHQEAHQVRRDSSCASVCVQQSLQSQLQQQLIEQERQSSQRPELQASGEGKADEKFIAPAKSPPPLMAAAVAACASGQVEVRVEAVGSTMAPSEGSEASPVASLPASSSSGGIPGIDATADQPRGSSSSEVAEAAEAAGLLEGLEVGARAIQENAYLRQNVDYLRQRKRQLENQVQAYESRVRSVEAQRQQYKALFEESQQQSAGNAAGGELEILNLQQQLAALMLLKDALNAENLELQNRNKALESLQKGGHATCVICMDNLANVVCMPCKHLAMCSFCSQHSYDECRSCPICRGDITDRMLIYMP